MRDEEQDVDKIVKLAEKLIASQIRETALENSYPAKKEMSSYDFYKMSPLLQGYSTKQIETSRLGAWHCAGGKTHNFHFSAAQHGSENLLISLSLLFSLVKMISDNTG